MIAEGLLHGMQHRALRQARDRADRFALHLDRKDRARIRALAVDDPRACPAAPAIPHALLGGEVDALARFLGERGWTVLRSELVWVWLPAVALGLALRLARSMGRHVLTVSRPRPRE